MKNDSIRLAWVGALLAILALSASFFARVRPQARPAGSAGAGETASGTADAARLRESEAFGEEAAAAMATLPEQGSAPAPRTGDKPETASGRGAETAPGRFSVRLRRGGAGTGERLFLCDGAGCPLEAPDPDPEALLGPLAPGRYLLTDGGRELGAFTLGPDGALLESSGRLRTDGAGLILEPAE